MVTADASSSRSSSLSSGMILLAQQLIGAYGQNKKSTNDSAAFAYDF